MHKRAITIVFIIGIALGVLGTLVLPDYVRSFLPESFSGKEPVVTGTVLAKQKEGQVLLLSVNTSKGALLATFKKKIDEVNLLVNVKDEIEFTLDTYTPFIEDPKITRVVKEQHALSPEPATAEAAPAKAAEKSAQERKPQRPGKSAAAAPVPGDKKTEK